jgi:hypothetical protein
MLLRRNARRRRFASAVGLALRIAAADPRALLPARAGDEFQASEPSKEVSNRKESA